MELGRLLDVSEELIKVFSLRVDPVVHPRGAPNPILISKDLYLH
jgi:hypothetical protein